MPDMSLGMNGLIADTTIFFNLILSSLFNYRVSNPTQTTLSFN